MAKVIKTEVIALRLTSEENAEVESALKADPMVGIKSKGMLARKLLLDYSRNKLRWASKKDKYLAPDVNLASAKSVA